MPSKEQVREYMQQRSQEHAPPPSLERIREMLGWKLQEEYRKQQQAQALRKK